MAHWKTIRKVGKRCVSEKGKFLKSSACGGKKSKRRKSKRK